MNKIYVIDNEENVSQYAGFITQKGFLLFVGKNPDQIVNEIEEELPDVILLNIDSSEDEEFNILISIIDFCQNKKIPIVALSEDIDSEQGKNALELGVHTCSLFPPSEDSLDSLFSELIKKKKQSLSSVLNNAKQYSNSELFYKDFLPLLSLHIQVDKIAFLLINDDKKFMEPSGFINLPPPTMKKVKFSKKKNLVKILSKQKKPIRTTKLFSDLKFMDISFDEKEKLLQIEADVVVPLHFMKEFKGILTLGKKSDESKLKKADLEEITKISHRFCSSLYDIGQSVEDDEVVSEEHLEVEEEGAVVDYDHKYIEDDDVSPDAVEIDSSDLPTMDFEKGEIFANRFTIHEHLGRGGLGYVYLVQDNNLDEEMVIKIIDPRLSENEIEALKKNLSFSRKSSHNNIIPYFDFKEDGDYRYITMAFMQGKTLKQLLEEESRLAFRKGILIIMDICYALEAVHETGFFHGNLKPNNILVDNNENAKLLDLGMRRPFDIQDQLSKHIIEESVEYISPEQADGGNIDHRTDIYSLGIIMYQMFTGVVPFKSDTPVATALLQVETAPMPPRKFNTYLPFTIEEIILKCLEKSPKNRYSTTEEILKNLENLDAEKSGGVYDDQFVAVRQSDQVETFLEAGKQCFSDGRYLDAISVMKKILSISPQHEEATEIIETASQKLELDPKGVLDKDLAELDIDDILNIASNQIQQSDYKSSLESLKSILARDPEHKKANSMLAEAQKKLLQEEVKQKKEEEKQRTKQIKQLFKDGKKLFKSGEYQQCIDNMEEILELDSMHSGAMKLIEKSKKFTE